MARLADVVFFFYFLSHIPISILVDYQAIFPDYYPQQLTDIRLWYCKTFRDPMMMEPPVWFRSFIYCELFLQLPFFFVAAYGFFKGAKACPWLRWPCVVYGSHVATTLIPIMYHVLMYDFSNSKYPGPRNLNDRLFLMSIYMPYFIVPLLIMFDAIFSSAYRQGVTRVSQQKSKKIR